MTPAPTPPRRTRFARVVLASLALASLPATASAAAPDPLDRGPFAVTEVQQYKVGKVNLQEPNAGGGAIGTGTPPNAANAASLQVRGSLYVPANRTTPAPVIVLVHGNHGSCQIANPRVTPPVPSGGSAPNCTIFERNDLGYGYLANNLASHGYAVASIDQDQLMFYQDGTSAKGMHQRRLMIAAQLDGLFEANQTALPGDADHNLGASLVGKLDFSRVGLMGHSRGGDAVTSFMDYNRERPAPGRRYNLAGVISLAQVDYENRAPYGSAYLSILPACDGDVSNLQGARTFERSQYARPGDPFPKIQMYLLGANHNYFNSVWSADNDDSSGANDPACGPYAANAATSIRLTGGTLLGQSSTARDAASLLTTYSRADAFSSDQALMGDQERIGLATMSAFFRRYVGNELAFDPYMTGERTAETGNNNLPASACPTSVSGTRIACDQYLQTSYFAPHAERTDVIGPSPDHPLSVSDLGTALTASGFANPYTDQGGVLPKPATTASGADWCNPEPDQFQPSNLGITTLPTAAKACPLPNAAVPGGQSSNRENAPVNHSYGLQLALAWDAPATPAKLETRIPAADGDLSTKKALAFGAAVNFFDARNPTRTPEAEWNPAATTQDFAVVLTDAGGRTATVQAGDRRYGTALQPSTGALNARLHIVLNQVRVPLADFAAQGLDLTAVRRIAFVFGASGDPQSGSIQLSDVRFQESVSGPTALTGRDGSVEPADVIPETPRAAASPDLPDVVKVASAAAAEPAPAAKGAPVTPVATDTTAPTFSVVSKRVAGRKVTLRGIASDVGIGAAKGTVKTVQVALTKRSGKACRYVSTSGKLKSAPCAAAGTLVAKGTNRWSLTLRSRIPAGRYTVTVTVIDAAGNVARKPAGTILVR